MVRLAWATKAAVSALRLRRVWCRPRNIAKMRSGPGSAIRRPLPRCARVRQVARATPSHKSPANRPPSAKLSGSPSTPPTRRSPSVTATASRGNAPRNPNACSSTAPSSALAARTSPVLPSQPLTEAMRPGIRKSMSRVDAEANGHSPGQLLYGTQPYPRQHACNKGMLRARAHEPREGSGRGRRRSRAGAAGQFRCDEHHVAALAPVESAQQELDRAGPSPGQGRRQR